MKAVFSRIGTDTLSRDDRTQFQAIRARFPRLKNGEILKANVRNVSFLYRVFTFYSIDTSKPYTPRWLQVPTSDSVHTKIKGIRFENISVNSPVILHRSVIGSAYDNAVSDFSFVNININGTVVTEQNKDEFFEIEYDKVKGLTFSER